MHAIMERLGTMEGFTMDEWEELISGKEEEEVIEDPSGDNIIEYLESTDDEEEEGIEKSALDELLEYMNGATYVPVPASLEKKTPDEIKEMFEKLTGGSFLTGVRPSILMGSPTVPVPESEEEESEGCEEAEQEVERPKNIRVILMYSEEVDKVIICILRKGRYLETRGSRSGLKGIDSISPYLTAQELHSGFEEHVEGILRDNLDFDVIIDEESDDMKEISTIVNQWAVDGTLPKKKEEGGGWWDNEDKKGRWDIDRGLEEDL